MKLERPWGGFFMLVLIFVTGCGSYTGTGDAMVDGQGDVLRPDLIFADSFDDIYPDTVRIDSEAEDVTTSDVGTDAEDSFDVFVCDSEGLDWVILTIETVGSGPDGLVTGCWQLQRETRHWMKWNCTDDDTEQELMILETECFEQIDCIVSSESFQQSMENGFDCDPVITSAPPIVMRLGVPEVVEPWQEITDCVYADAGNANLARKVYRYVTYRCWTPESTF